MKKLNVKWRPETTIKTGQDLQSLTSRGKIFKEINNMSIINMMTKRNGENPFNRCSKSGTQMTHNNRWENIKRMTSRYLIILIVLLSTNACSKEPDDMETLDARYAAQWDKPEYRAACTADEEDYLSVEEKEVYKYLNFVRINPLLFAQTYATGYDGDNGWSKGYAWDERKASLIDELLEMEPLPLVYPDSELYELASCFAYRGGQLGIVGHDRSSTGCSTGYHAECCHYGGAKNGLSIVMALLIDAGENNAALGHRRILLDGDYVKLGVSIQPHVSYKINAVLDFRENRN
jgi:hypothetical protein